ncbi:DUF300-domain-containing protein [Corynespora cassiicola Philippines]|uniref:DUF300-domain-containing protein n=1 Tax=Corynespora cassiicola Philippines TaxID=1448308 RepID=A0A2T2P8P7_CORCC|nr:DUF300-domain-containing protein [Corynespora cassiicola Philippines]
MDEKSPHKDDPLGIAKAIRSLGKNATCNSEKYEHEKIAETPVWGSLTFHRLGLIISAIFGALAVAIAFFLIWRHATHYLKPYEQRPILRILVMIPIYAVVSFFSYVYYKNAIYFEVLRDCYEAFAIASFFTLLCHYIAPTLHEQKEYFRTIEPKNWVWPITWMQKCSGGENKGWLRKPTSGLTWFNVVWISIFQYCFIRPFFTAVAVITQTQGLYCQSSMDPRYSYIWVAGFEAVSVTIAMYCLIQFYIQLKDDLAPHRPFLKVLCIKLVIFFCFWQSWIISLLTAEGGPIKSSDKFGGPDLRIGIPAMLTCVEMAIFAIMHLYAFTWRPYDLGNSHDASQVDGSFASLDSPKQYAHGPMRALLDALNPWDIIKACGRGFRWLFVGVRHRKKDPSYQTKLEPMSSSTEYQSGPTFAGNGEAATEVSRPGPKKEGFEDSDTAGLLSNAQANPYTNQNSYHGAYDGPDTYRDPDSLPSAPLPGQEYGLGLNRQYTDFEPQDTSYNGAGDIYSPPRYYHSNPADDPGRMSTEWDMFAGATNSGSRPPGAR